MFEVKFELFEEALKTKMFVNATDELKSTFYLMNDTIIYRNLTSDDGEQLKSALYEHFQHIAHEYDFKFELNFLRGKYQSIKWYYNDIRILPINGIIKPFKTKKTSKRNPINAALRHEALVRDGYRCLECGASNKEISLEVDHIIPVSQGGTDELHNLQTLCITCNRAKNIRTWKAGQI